MAAASRKRHVSSAAAEQEEKRVKIDLNDTVAKILQSKKHANAVFDIFEVLQVKTKVLSVRVCDGCSFRLSLTKVILPKLRFKYGRFEFLNTFFLKCFYVFVVEFGS